MFLLWITKYVIVKNVYSVIFYTVYVYGKQLVLLNSKNDKKASWKFHKSGSYDF